MKNLVLLFLLFISKSGFSNDKPVLETVKIKTSAICGMCKKTIERNLAFEKGIASSDLDVDSKIVTIKYNPKRNIKVL